MQAFGVLGLYILIIVPFILADTNDTTGMPLVLCTFEENFCDWKNVNPDSGFERKTAEELATESRPGPDAGWNGVKNDHFLITEDSQEGSVAALKSPYFLSEEHPVECFWFWFYFSLEGDEDAIAIYLESKDDQRIKDLWFLTNTWSDEQGWQQGRVEISIDNLSDVLEYQIVVMASKGKNVKSYVAVDQFEFEFVQSSVCETYPPEAKPLTTPAPVTTPAPTEPPGHSLPWFDAARYNEFTVIKNNRYNEQCTVSEVGPNIYTKCIVNYDNMVSSGDVNETLVSTGKFNSSWSAFSRISYQVVSGKGIVKLILNGVPVFESSNESENRVMLHGGAILDLKIGDEVWLETWQNLYADFPDQFTYGGGRIHFSANAMD